MNPHPHDLLPTYESETLCPRCNTRKVADFGNLGAICVACLDICVEHVMRETKGRHHQRGIARLIIQEAVDLYCRLKQADKTPGN